MKEPKFKEGEKCYHCFELVTVKITNKDKIEEVTDGFFSCSSYDLSDYCFPDNAQIKNISEYVKNMYKLVSNLNGNLNFPEIRRRFVDIWIDMCINIDNDKELEGLSMKLDNFASTIIERYKQYKTIEVDDIKIFN
jgi:hypothetical protein